MKNKANLILGIISIVVLIYCLIRCFARPSILIIMAIIFELTSCIMLLSAWRRGKQIKS